MSMYFCSRIRAFDSFFKILYITIGLLPQEQRICPYNIVAPPRVLQLWTLLGASYDHHSSHGPTRRTLVDFRRYDWQVLCMLTPHNIFKPPNMLDHLWHVGTLELFIYRAGRSYIDQVWSGLLLHTFCLPPEQHLLEGFCILFTLSIHQHGNPSSLTCFSTNRVHPKCVWQ